MNRLVEDISRALPSYPYRRCSGPMCGEPAAFQFAYRIQKKSGPSAAIRNYCEKHAASFAKKHGLTLPKLSRGPESEGGR